MLNFLKRNENKNSDEHNKVAKNTCNYNTNKSCNNITDLCNIIQEKDVILKNINISNNEIVFKLKEIKSKMACYNNAVNNIKTCLDNISPLMKMLGDKHEEATNIYDFNEKKISEVCSSLNNLKNLNDKSEAELHELENTYKTLLNETSFIKDETENVNKVNENLSLELNSIENTVITIEKELQGKTNMFEECTSLINKIEHELNETKSSFYHKTIEFEREHQKYEKYTEKLIKKSDKLNNIKQQGENILSKNRSIQLELTKKSQILKNLMSEDEKNCLNFKDCRSVLEEVNKMKYELDSIISSNNLLISQIKSMSGASTNNSSLITLENARKQYIAILERLNNNKKQLFQLEVEEKRYQLDMKTSYQDISLIQTNNYNISQQITNTDAELHKLDQEIMQVERDIHQYEKRVDIMKIEPRGGAAKVAITRRRSRTLTVD